MPWVYHPEFQLLYTAKTDWFEYVLILADILDLKETKRLSANVFLFLYLVGLKGE